MTKHLAREKGSGQVRSRQATKLNRQLIGGIRRLESYLLLA